MIKVVVLVLTVWNTSDGTKLYESTRDWNGFNVSGNPIEDCRRYGVLTAHRLTEKYKIAGYAWASTNVNCHWESRLGAPA